MSYSCSDFTNDVVNQLYASGLAKPENLPDGDLEAQAQYVCDAIYTLKLNVVGLRDALAHAVEACEPEWRGDTEPAWMTRARELLIMPR